MAEREQILADFQACTGLDDVEICITVLEQHEWNLEAAVQSLMPEDHEGTSSAITTSDRPQRHTSVSSMDLTGASTVPYPTASLAVGASTSLTFVDSDFYRTSNSHTYTRMLRFIVEYRNKTISLVLPDTETVGKIKEILGQDLGISKSEMKLEGLKPKKMDDFRVLRDLELPSENRLYLLTPHISVCNNPELSEDYSDQTYTLNITYRDVNSYRNFSPRFPGHKTIYDVKSSMCDIINLPVRHQKWSGWPLKTEDITKLSDAGLTVPVHNLEISGTPPKRQPSPLKESSSLQLASDSEEESIEPFTDEDMFIPDESDSSLTTLLPPDAEDDVKGLEHFTAKFIERYGDFHPLFYIGSLEGSIRDSLLVRARERKPLAIYLHDDRSILSNVFCSQIFCSESIVNYLSENFILWAWDLTHDSNKQRLLDKASRHFGSMASSQLQMCQVDQMPVLLIIMRTRGSNEVFTVISGNTTLDDMMTTLIHAVEVFHGQQQTDISEEDEREKRELIKKEQDNAYNLSLEADRAKVKAEQDKHDMLKKEEEKKQEEEQFKEAIKESLALSLPKEPPSTSKKPVCEFRIRTPSGDTVSRRFLACEPLHILLQYVASIGFDTHQYKVLTSYPRRDITQLDIQISLSDHKFHPRETLILEERL